MTRKRLLARRYRYVPESIINLNSLQARAKESIIEKMATGVYTLESAPCFCGAASDVVLAERDRYGLNVSTVICTECGLIRTNPKMTQQAYVIFYDREYRPLYGGSPKANESFFQEQLGHGLKICSFIRPYVRGSTVFDIGCGAGGVLLAFQQQNWQVAGVDYGEKYLRYGRSRGITDLFKGSSKELLLLREKADLIILSHVLEHFLDIRSELGTISRLLKPGGFVYIELPGIKWLHKSYKYDFLRCIQNAHTYYFSLNTLEYILNCCGFELIYGNEIIQSLFRMAEHQICCKDMNSEYQQTMDYLERTEKMRRWRIGKIRAVYTRRIQKLHSKHMVTRLFRALSFHGVKRLVYSFLMALTRISSRVTQNRSRLLLDVKYFWSQTANDDKIRDLAHWRDSGRWNDHIEWLEIGKRHFAMINQMLEQYSPWHEQDYSTLRVVDFGCGGGANCIELCQHFGNVYGVDISEPTLGECTRQINSDGLEDNFIPILIPTDNPEDCLDKIGCKVHIFLSTAVYQHFPSRDYGVRVTQLASHMLEHPGFALIQIRYDDGTPRFRKKTRNYLSDAVTFTSYRSDEFAAICRDSGFEILGSERIPEVNYEYYFLCRR